MNASRLPIFVLVVLAILAGAYFWLSGGAAPDQPVAGLDPLSSALQPERELGTETQALEAATLEGKTKSETTRSEASLLSRGRELLVTVSAEGTVPTDPSLAVVAVTPTTSGASSRIRFSSFSLSS